MNAANRKLSICIVSHNAYGFISGKGGFIGGVEWQTSLTARWLAGRGHAVSFVTWNEGGPREESLEGVRVLTLCARDAGIPGLRFFHPKWTSLVGAMRRAAADVYYHNCAECTTGQIALWCRANGKRFVFSAANDYDCDGRLPELRTRRERVLYRYGLRAADRRIVQTRNQQDVLRRDFGLEADVIPMPSAGPAVLDWPVPPHWPPARVLWVGRVCRQKRPDLLLDVAERCPELTFDVVGPVYESEYAAEVVARAARLPNVAMHGPVDREGIEQFYREGACLCSTSDNEGFPNTFLEAWSHGLPIVTRFDPDGLIVERGFGYVADDAAGLVECLRRLYASREAYAAFSRNARRYYEENHAFESIMPRFEKVFLEAVYGAQGLREERADVCRIPD